MKTVAIVNNKGGVGRTTLAVHLALHASALGIKTTAVSLCRQGDLYAWLSGGQRAASPGDVMQISSCLDVVFSPDEIPELGEASLVVYDCPSIFTIPVRDDVVRAPPTTPVHRAWLEQPPKPAAYKLWIPGAPTPDLWLIPTPARPPAQLLVDTLHELTAEGGTIWCVLYAAMNQAVALQALSDATSQFPNVKVCDHKIPDSPLIRKAADDYRSAWEGRLGDRDPHALALSGLCDEILTQLDLAPRH